MEFSGEVISGNFVAEVPGIQFTLPDYCPRFAELLRSPEKPVILHVNDPASPAGVSLDALKERIPSRRGDRWAVYQKGHAVLVYAQKSGQLEVSDTSNLSEYGKQLFDFLRRLPFCPGKIVVSSINGVPVHSSELKDTLISLGFVSRYKDISLYSSRSD
jgi:hypothetical protein